MNCSISDFKDNVTVQMLQYGYGVAAMQYSNNTSMQNALKKLAATNQIPKSITVANKKYRGFDVAQKIANSINEGWKSMVANVQLTNDTYSIGINISPDLMKLLEAADFTAEERSTINDMVPGYANTIEEEAILKYENMTNSDIDKVVSAQSASFLDTVLQTLKRAFPTIEYKIVSDADAREITKASSNPYDGQGVSFFYNGTVYIIEGNLTPETLIHEFLHPLVKSIEVDNPALFRNLVDESKTVDSTYRLGVEERLQEELANNPDAYAFDENAYDREYMTRVLDIIARERLLENREESMMYNLISKFFYALKQLFRKVFGSKINVSKLSVYTSLSDLSDMLKMSEFNLNNELFTTKDYVEYLTKVQEEIDRTAKILADATIYNETAAKDPNNLKHGLSNLEDYLKQLEGIINSNFDYFKKNGTIDNDLKAIIFNSETGNLENVKKQFRLNRKFDNKEQEELAEEIEKGIVSEKDDTQKAITLMSSMLQIQGLVENLAGPNTNILVEKTSSDDPRQNITLINKLESMLLSFQTLAESLNDIIVTRDPNSTLAKSLNQTITYAKNGQRTLVNQRFKNIKDVINITVSTVNDTIASGYNDAIAKIDEEIARNGSSPILESRKAYYIKTRDQLVVSEKRIEDMLSGKAGDSSFIEGYILSAIQSSDPIYGTLGSMVKNAYNNIEANIVGVYEQYYQQLNDLQNKAGITKFNYTSRYREMITTGSRLVEGAEEVDGDTQKTLEERNDFLEFKHSTLISEAFKDLKRLEFEYKQAKDNNNRTLQSEKAREIAELKEKYFFGATLEGNTQRKQLLSTDWGKRIDAKQVSILEDIRVLELALKYEVTLGIPESKKNILDYQNQIQELYIDLNEVTSFRNKNGDLKEGQDYDDVQAFKDFYTKTETDLELDLEETTEKFIEAYKLNEKLLGANTQEFAKWLSENTYIKKKPEYFALAQEIFTNIETINNRSTSFSDKLKELNARRSELGKTLNQLRVLFSDPRSKTMLIDFMTPEAIKKINDIADELFEIEIQIDIERGLPSNVSKQDIRTLHTVRKLYAGDFEYESKEPELKKSLKQTNYLLYEKYKGIKDALQEFREKQPSNAEQELINTEWSKFYDIQYKDKTIAYEMYRKKAIEDVNGGRYADISFISTDSNFVKALTNKKFRKFIEDHHTLYTIEEYGTVSYAYVPNGIHIEQKINDNYKEMINFTYVNEKGQTQTIRTNFPAIKYQSFYLKEEVKTPRIMGVTTNAFGEWLPKPIEVLYAESQGTKITSEFLQNIPEISESQYRNFKQNNEDLTKYVNDDYYNLKKNDINLWNLLEFIKKMSFEQQKDSSKSGRLNFQVPSFFVHDFEVTQKLLSGQERSGLSTFLSSVKAKLFGKTGDEAEEGFSNITNTETEEERRTKLKLVSLDFFGDELSKIPVAGKYPIELDKVSMDIPYSMFRYFYSLEELKEKVKIMPIAKGLEKVLSDETNALKEMNSLQKYAFLTNNLTIFGAKNAKEASVRLQMVQQFNRTIFEGENLRGFMSDKPEILKALNTVTRFTSTVFLSTPESAIRNRVQMGLQNIINLASGDGVDKTSYAKGEAWTTRFMTNQMTHAYKGDTYTLEEMLVDMFDPNQGSSKQRIGRSFNRSYAQDAAEWQSFVMAPRKWLEKHGAVKMWAQRMFFEKIEITENGVTTEIPYMEAWEIRDGKLSLRNGVAETYNIGGAKFNLIKNRIHQQIALTNGDTSALGRSYGDKFVMYNQILSMRRFFYMMFMNRFGANVTRDKSKSMFSFKAYSWVPRVNYSTGDPQEGYYISTLRILSNYLKGMFTSNPDFNIHWSTLTPYEKKNMLKALTEIMISLVFLFVINILFGYDPDDEDRYKKLRANSAPLPIFGTAEEGQFEVGGYAFNKALQLILGFQEEHNTFIPLPGLGLQSYNKMAQLKMATLQPTFDIFTKSITYASLAAFGDKRAYYDKRVGPYGWQQKESAKIINLWLKYLSLTGTTIDPILDIQRRESFARL